MPLRFIFTAAGLVGLTAAALTHESSLLVAVENEHHPESGVTVGTLFEFERTNGEDVFTLSPALAIGVHPHVALGVSAHFTDEHGNFAFESVLPNLQLLWHPKDEGIPIHIHAQLGYQFADEQGEAEEEHAGEGEHHHEEEEEEAGHRHDFRSAVHSHGLDLFTGRVELDYRFGNTLLRAGVIGTVFDDGDTGFGYSAGILQRVIEPLHIALDAFGDFDSGGYHEIAGTIYFRAAEGLQLSAGLAFGLRDETPDSIVRLGVTCRF